MRDTCPICFDGTLRITDADRISWAAVCDVCGQQVEVTDVDLEYDRDYDPPFRAYVGHALILIVLFILGAYVEVMP